jgi:hypothetical protein
MNTRRVARCVQAQIDVRARRSNALGVHCALCRVTCLTKCDTSSQGTGGVTATSERTLSELLAGLHAGGVAAGGGGLACERVCA